MSASSPPPAAPAPGEVPTAGRALVACHVAVALFGFASLFGKWIAWDAVAIVLGRTLVAAVLLAAVIAFRRGALPRPTRPLALNGVILAVHWTAFFAAIQASSVAIGLLGFASFPLFVPWLERVLLGVPMARAKLWGAALVAVGLVLVVPDVRWIDGSGPGLAWGLVSGFTFALLAVRSQRLVVQHAATAIALWQNAVAAAVVAPIVLARGLGGPLHLADIGLVVLLGAVCTALAHTLFTASLARLSAHTVAICAALEPVYGIALAFVLLGEVPGLRIVAGVVLLMGAALVASWRGAR